MHHRHPCISSPAFSPFFNTSFLFRSNRCTPRPPRPKVVSTIFPLTDSSLSLSSYLILSTFYPFVYFARTCKNRQVGGGGKRDEAFRWTKASLYRKFFSNETNSSTLEEDVRTVVQKSIRSRVSRGRCDREQGGRWEGNKVAVCRSKCQISVAVSPFRAS